MSTKEQLLPDFNLTPEQSSAFANYGPLDAIRATVAARILSGDPSALVPTDAQIAFVHRLASAMGLSLNGLPAADDADRGASNSR